MKYITLFLASVLVSCGLSLPAQSAPKFLEYKYNDSVLLVISSVSCPFDQIKKEYPFAAAALRSDGQKLAGCYKPQDENLIEIQWYKGDKTVVPANAFLTKPIEVVPVLPPTL
jgi:hypothetical protein